MHKTRATGINAALVSAFFLGLAPVFGKAAMEEGHFSPLAVVAIRTSLAALLLALFFAIFSRKSLYIYPAGLMGCALAGLINGTGSIFYYIGLSKLNASVAQLLYVLYPFFVAFWLRLDWQTPSRLTVLRIVLAVISAILLVQADAGNVDPQGVAFMLIASALYALHLPINQRVLYDVPAPTVTVYTLTAMSIVVVIAYLGWDRSSLPDLNASWSPVFALTGVTFFSRLLLFLGVKYIGGMQTALLGLAEVLVAILFSHLFLQESLIWLQWLGAGGLALSLLMVWFEKPSTNPAHPHGLLGWLQPPDFTERFRKKK